MSEEQRPLTTCQEITKEITKLLLPCPFCGHEADIFGVSNGSFRIGCANDDCGATLPHWLPFEKDEFASEKIALGIEYWNKRV